VLPREKPDAFAIAPVSRQDRMPYLPLVGTGPGSLELPAGRLAGVMEGDQFVGEGRGHPLVQVVSAGWFSSQVRAVRGRVRPRLGVTPRRPFLRLASALLRIITGRKGALPPDLRSRLADVAVGDEREGPADLRIQTDETTGQLEVIELSGRRVQLGDVHSSEGRAFDEYLASYRLRRQLLLIANSAHPLGLRLTEIVQDGADTAASRPAVRLGSESGGYLLLLHVDPAGEVRVLWPGVGRGNGAMRRRRDYTTGTPEFPSPFAEHGLPGTHDLVAILCRRPILSQPLGALLADAGSPAEPRWRPVKPGSEEGLLALLTDLLSLRAGREESPDLDVACLPVTVGQHWGGAPAVAGKAAPDSVLH
jgi:hypothetical protein